MQILLVEDELHVRIALARPLTGWGFNVTEVASLGQASAHLVTMRPDLAIVDINLPDGTGWDVLQLVHRCSAPEIPTIDISAIAPSTERLRQFRPFGVLLKPFPIESLHQLVTRATTTTDNVDGEQGNA